MEWGHIPDKKDERRREQVMADNGLIKHYCSAIIVWIMCYGAPCKKKGIRVDIDSSKKSMPLIRIRDKESYSGCLLYCSFQTTANAGKRKPFTSMVTNILWQDPLNLKVMTQLITRALVLICSLCKSCRCDYAAKRLYAGQKLGLLLSTQEFSLQHLRRLEWR